MGGIKDASVRLSTAAVRGDERGPVEDPDLVHIDRHLDVLANERVRHAIAHRLDIDEGVVRSPGTVVVEGNSIMSVGDDADSGNGGQVVGNRPAQAKDER